MAKCGWILNLDDASTRAYYASTRVCMFGNFNDKEGGK